MSELSERAQRVKERQAAANRSREDSRDDYRGLVRRVLNTPDGTRLLKAWEEAYVRRTSFTADTHAMAFREGERAFVLDLQDITEGKL